MSQWVDISFDCLPLRTVGRLDAPIDASPRYREFCERVKAAIEKHGAHNTYYLYNAHCVYHLTNDGGTGMLSFLFDGVVLTTATDNATQTCDLNVELQSETCDWLTQPVVEWFAANTLKAVEVEFNRYIAAGDLQAAKERVEKIQQASDEADGFMGMYL